MSLKSPSPPFLNAPFWKKGALWDFEMGHLMWHLGGFSENGALSFKMGHFCFLALRKFGLQKIPQALKIRHFLQKGAFLAMGLFTQIGQIKMWHCEKKAPLVDFLQLTKKPHFDSKKPTKATLNVAFFRKCPILKKKGHWDEKSPIMGIFLSPSLECKGAPFAFPLLEPIGIYRIPRNPTSPTGEHWQMGHFLRKSPISSKICGIFPKCCIIPKMGHFYTEWGILCFLPSRRNYTNLIY